MAMIGNDFRRARREWLYTSVSGQHVGFTILFAGIVFALYSVLQIVSAVVVHLVLFGAPDFTNPTFTMQPDFLKSIVIGMLPSAILGVLMVWVFSLVMNRTGDKGLPLHFPDLGALGWVIVLGGFMLVMFIWFAGFFAITGLDPQQYMPTSGGVNDQNSSSGMVEKTIADLADEPLLFALAVPGIVIGAPLVEEFVFRGPLFSALRNTRLGGWGAILITSAIFALMHAMAAPWVFVCLLFGMAIGLGFLMLRFGSIWVPFAAHALWNGMTTLNFFVGMNAQ
jgi:membrane protease YdiL (CAAX protease family)